MNNKCDKNNRRKKESIILSDDKQIKLLSIGNNTNCKSIKKPKKLTEISAKILQKVDKGAKIIDCDEDNGKSFLKMSVKMKNSYFDENEFDDRQNVLSECSPSHFKSVCSNSKKICSSCRNTQSTQIIKCKTSEAQFHVSIKSKRPLCCRKSEIKTEINNGSDIFLDKHLWKQQNNNNNCCLTVKEETKLLRLDLLLQFLDQMRHIVVTRELSFDTFQSITERLMKDKMNIELLLLTEVIIRAQVVQMTKLITKDLCNNKITPPLFVKSFLKQYQFLKSLSVVYKQFLEDYESSYLAINNLSFDLISRAYFKLLIQDSPKIKEQLSCGHLNIKLDSIFDSGMSSSEREQIKINYANLKLDFQDTGNNKCQETDKTIRHILNSPDDIVKSLVKYFNIHFAACFPRSAHCKKECCNQKDRSTLHHPDGSYKEILRMLLDLPDRDICSISLISPTSLEYLLKTSNNTNNNISSSSSCHDYDIEIPISSKYYHSSSNKKKSSSCTISGGGGGVGAKVTTTTMTTMTSTYQSTLENIKPPSISCSSSSNNSNGYNSCVSISSYEESSDEEGDNNQLDDKDERFFEKWKRKCCGGGVDDDVNELALNEETKPPTPVSFNDDDDVEEDCESANENQFTTAHKRYIFRDTDSSVDNQEEIAKFNKLYEQYLAENEHLLDQATLSCSSSSHMSVPDYLNTLEKADNLQSIIKILMAKYKKNIDIQEKISRHPAGPHCLSTLKQDGKEHNRQQQEEEEEDDDDEERDEEEDDDDDEQEFEDLNFEELSRTLESGSSTRDSLQDFEKFLGNKLNNGDNNNNEEEEEEEDGDGDGDEGKVKRGGRRKGGGGGRKSHPNLEALVKTCRVYCNKLYESGSSSREQENKRRDKREEEQAAAAAEEERVQGQSGDSKQTVSGDESFDLPSCVVNNIVEEEQEEHHGHLHHSHHHHHHSHHPHSQMSDTGSTSTENNNNNNHNNNNSSSNNNNTNNNNNNRVCNCCKCEMFGEQTFSTTASSATSRATNVVEKLRIKLKQRKQCKQQMRPGGGGGGVVVDKLPDVDSLVEFINGGGGSEERDTKAETSGINSSSITAVQKKTVKGVKTQGNKGHNKTQKKSGRSTERLKLLNGSGGGEKDSAAPTHDSGSTKQQLQSGHSNGLSMPDEVSSEKEFYDPVVEDFKKFCSNVVVTKHRKKLPLAAETLLIGGVLVNNNTANSSSSSTKNGAGGGASGAL